MILDLDTKVSFISGAILSGLNGFMFFQDILMTAAVGLVGGFFGIMGKELYKYFKSGFIDE
jgi:hypothetical protein